MEQSEHHKMDFYFAVLMCFTLGPCFTFYCLRPRTLGRHCRELLFYILTLAKLLRSGYTWLRDRLLDWTPVLTFQGCISIGMCVNSELPQSRRI